MVTIILAVVADIMMMLIIPQRVKFLFDLLHYTIGAQTIALHCFVKKKNFEPKLLVNELDFD